MPSWEKRNNGHCDRGVTEYDTVEPLFYTFEGTK
jgi:hypothetical protein